MTLTVLRSTLAALACTAVLVLASPSMAAMLNLKADLKASNEVPPNDSKGSGSLTATPARPEAWPASGAARQRLRW